MEKIQPKDKRKRDPMRKGYCFTINNPTLVDEQQFGDNVAKFQYAIFGREKGKEGTKHLQCYVHFKSQQRFKAMKDLWPRAHIEGAKGTAIENQIYCRKEGNFVEFGECPLDGATKTKRNFEAAKNLAIQGLIDDIEPNIYVPYYNTLKAIADDHLPEVESMPDLDNEWHYGPSGTNKSRSVREKYPDAFIKSAATEWWCGYTNEEVVIIEDFDKYHVKQGYNLKLYGDHYPFPANRKSRPARKIRPKRILVTSNWTPREIWSDAQTYGPIERRYKLVEHKIPVLVQPLIPIIFEKKVPKKQRNPLFSCMKCQKLFCDCHCDELL